MYGGYGNIWNQGSAQWPSANVTNQNQLPVQNQQTQQNMLGYGGNLTNIANPNVAAAGMMNYMNMGGGGANPFMNYGGNTTGFGLQPATTNASPWLGNQQFQLHQAFPGGRPPLPPGPPPPDTPKDKPQLGQFGNQIQQPPLPTSSNLGNFGIQQRAPPPPPPPPPPSQPAPLQQTSTDIISGVNLAGSTVPGNHMNLEDAYNIIKNAAAYGMLPSCGPLPPLTTLNVSEELFGSKNSNKGIPGLDMVEEDKPSTPKGPEVVDLENEAENLKSKELKSSDNINTAAIVNSSFFVNDESVNRNHQSKNNKSVENFSSDSNELVWELRTDVKTQEWKRADLHTNGGADRIDKGSKGWGTKQQVNDSRVSETPSNSLNDLGKFKHDEEPSKKKSNFAESIVDSDNRVMIPLESVDGKELVYDRRTLKQFDHKFREWENQFEDWKRNNESHPNQSSYKQYLDQWNFWREQLIEQRRSILEKMTKAKLDCKEILMAKFESMDGSDADLKARSSESPNCLFVQKDDRESKRDSKLETPSETPHRTNDGRRPPPPTAPLISSIPEKNDNDSASNIPPLIPNLVGDKKPLLQAHNDERSVRDRPVERILRNSGVNRMDRNIFDEDFNRSQRDKNPFEMGNKSSPFEESSFSAQNKDMIRNESKFDSDSVRIPFNWSLPSSNEEDKNPFDTRRPSDNPFMQPSGPNPFEIKPEQRLPSLDDFIKRTSLDFSAPTSGPSKQRKRESENPFVMSSTVSPAANSSAKHSEALFERIPRDPQASTSNQPNRSTKPMRLEANPVGMPLLIAAKESRPEPQNETNEFSRLFSRDRGPPVIEDEDIEDSNYRMDDDYVEDAEVIDYGAGGGNSMDSMDFPRGENPDDNNNNDGNDDVDFSLEDSDVIDYSQGGPPQDPGMGHGQFPGGEEYDGFLEDFEQHDYPPPFHGPGVRGRGRGFPGHPAPAWGRGHPRGNPFGRGGPAPSYPPEYEAPRGRGSFRGMGRGMRGPPPPQQDWFHHDDREHQQQHAAVLGIVDPEVVELSPSPEPNVPHVKIAPPNPEFERGERRRSRSRDRSRSRSRERVSRRGREETDRREERSSGSIRERDRERRSSRSPDRRGRYDERDQRRERDRFRDRGRRGRSKSRSRSPTEDRNPVVRNPLFPSASAGMLGAHPASNPPPPRYQTVLIEDILNLPGRSKRPSRLVIFMRGLPGSGKSHIVKLIKEREVEMGGKAPRILSLDNYFITEMEKKEKDPVTGVEVKKTVMEYEFDEEREPLYRAQLVRQFKKTLDEGYFSFVIVDCVNEYVRQFEEMASVATQKRFQAYVAEIEESAEVCVKRNIHKRTRDEILKIHRNWERTPSQFVKLDTRTLLQDEAIQEVEMEDVSDVEADSVEKAPPTPTPAERGKIGPQVVDLEEIEDEDSGDHILQSSKWDTLEPSQEKLNKLDGLMRRRRANSEEAHVESAPSIETWLSGNMPEDYVLRKPTQAGQKRVRWADIEEKREQEKMRKIGFVVGQTDWKRMMDPTCGSSALTRTKFF